METVALRELRESDSQPVLHLALCSAFFFFFSLRGRLTALPALAGRRVSPLPTGALFFFPPLSHGLRLHPLPSYFSPQSLPGNISTPQGSYMPFLQHDTPQLFLTPFCPITLPIGSKLAGIPSPCCFVFFFVSYSLVHPRYCRSKAHVPAFRILPDVQKSFE